MSSLFDQATKRAIRALEELREAAVGDPGADDDIMGSIETAQTEVACAAELYDAKHGSVA